VPAPAIRCDALAAVLSDMPSVRRFSPLCPFPRRIHSYQQESESSSSSVVTERLDSTGPFAHTTIVRGE